MTILRVAIPCPVRHLFDYLAPPAQDPGGLLAGTRVRVPFGRSRRVGLLMATHHESSVDPSRLRPVEAVIDKEPLLPRSTLQLLEWAADYYHHPIGEVIFTALPGLLREGRAAEPAGPRRWRLTAAGQAAGPPVRGPRQGALAALLASTPRGLATDELDQALPGWRGAARALRARGLAETYTQPCLASLPRADPGPRLSPDQTAAVARIGAATAYAAFLLEGVTGSGKTEVYLSLIEQTLARGRQALILVPEIGLTPQLVDRFRRRLGCPVALLHSGLSEGERLCAWEMSRSGEAPVLVGTRSAAFVPMPRLGLIIVDEEHDASLKQQEGFRYSARDVAVMRARRESVTIVLGSATPSLETLHNVAQQRYARVLLPLRATGGSPPPLRLLDLRGKRLSHGLSDTLLASIAATLGAGQQVLLFLNRRGYAPVFLCHSCGYVANCRRCDAHMTLHRRSRRLRCHHCGAEQGVPEHCPACGSPKLLPMGSGTERLEATLADAFPTARVARLDRDSLQGKGTLEETLARIAEGRVDIVVGTQMVAKGHDFPRVTLAAVVDADGGLFAADFRAGERLAQLVVQVAGRAGRGSLPGRVLIQTHQPEHPLLLALAQHGYGHFARTAMAERAAARLPPHAFLALLRAESVRAEAARGFLQQARDAGSAASGTQVDLLGPVAAPMERRAGRYRYQVLVRARTRSPLQRFLTHWIAQVEALPAAQQVRWSLDVDPVDMG